VLKGDSYADALNGKNLVLVVSVAVNRTRRRHKPDHRKPWPLAAKICRGMRYFRFAGHREVMNGIRRRVIPAGLGVSGESRDNQKQGYSRKPHQHIPQRTAVPQFRLFSRLANHGRVILVPALVDKVQGAALTSALASC